MHPGGPGGPSRSSYLPKKDVCQVAFPHVQCKIDVPSLATARQQGLCEGGIKSTSYLGSLGTGVWES